MKILMMYAYYDKKNKSYDTPFFTFNDLFAQRKYQMDTKQEGSILKEFKEDFELYRLGFFDKLTGIFHIQEEKCMIVDDNGNFIQEEDLDAFSDEAQVQRGAVSFKAEKHVQS